jgi:hypothetical protein
MIWDPTILLLTENLISFQSPMKTLMGTEAGIPGVVATHPEVLEHERHWDMTLPNSRGTSLKGTVTHASLH